VTLAPQHDSLAQEITAMRLPRQASARSVRALDATPARETLMIIILFNAIAPAGCVSDLGRFRH
jgi:hypothetical protein